jgi:sigma-E factor negative regulatory protein RseC
VEIFLPPGRTIFAGFSVLIFPLLTFIAGFAAGGILIPESGEGLRALFGLAGLGLGFLLSYLYNRSAKSRNFPVLTRKIPG